jgi:ceramide glucosyltransferase
MNALDAVTVVLAIPALVSILYFPIAGWLLHRWPNKRPSAEGAAVVLPPVTFFRPLKAGVPDLAGKLTNLAQAMCPEDQLVIGAELGSTECQTAETVRAAFPALDFIVVACEPGEVQNPKMAKLLQMEPFARHEHWILSDSEAEMDVGFLATFRRDWLKCDALTAGYRFSHCASWPQRLDAAAVLLTLWPGLAILQARGGLGLTLGACSGFRRGDLQAVGGWRAVADDLAEDHRLGKELAAAGRSVDLCSEVVTLESDPLSWRDYWRHQRRVAVTYRVANPWGFAGASLSHGVTTAFLLVWCRPLEIWTWSLCAGVFLMRWITAHFAARKLGYPLRSLGMIVFVASLVESACWLLSWTSHRVWWSGRFRTISRSGRLLPLAPETH